MVSFERKNVTDGSIGDRLRQARVGRGESLESVERITQVSKKYIEAIEADEFKKLPDLVYAKNFVRALAKHYQLDPTSLTEELVKAMAVAGGRSVFGADRPVNFASGRRIVMTPSIMKTSLLVLVLLGIVGYFGVAVYRILLPPKITIYSPQDNQEFSDQEVVLEGQTEPGVELTVNRESVLIGTDGSFKDVLRLPPGVSILRVAGKKKHSKENEVYLKVVVDQPQPVVSASTTPQK